MKDGGLELLFANSLKYYREQGILFGQKFPDSMGEGSRRPADFWVLSKTGIHHVECKQITSLKEFSYDFNRLYYSGQYQQLLDFWSFSKLTNSWSIISFKNRKLKTDRYYIIHIHDYKLLHEWVGKNSIRLDEIEYYAKFEYPKISSKRYIDHNFAKIRPSYNIILEKISVSGVKGKIIKLDDILK